MKARIETITPQVAAEYLSHNIGNNRNIRQTLVESLARDMRNGAFTPTHQGIAFDTNGNLIDGQHRLSAIMSSGVTVEMMVTRDVSPDAIGKIDNGAIRNIGDAMKIKYTGQDKLSTAMRNRKCVNSVGALMRLCTGKRRFSIREFETFFSAFPAACADLSHAIYHTYGGVNGAVGAACLAAMMNGVPAEVIKKFVRVFGAANIDGCVDYNVQIALTFRHYLDGLRAKHTRMHEAQMFRAAQAVIYSFVSNNNRSRMEFDKISTDIYDVRHRVCELVLAAV